MMEARQFRALCLVLSFFLSGVMASVAEENEMENKTYFSGTETEAAQIVRAFHAALESGDRVAARSLLADDVLILEGGAIERSADEYAQHHMLDDLEYFETVSAKLIEHHIEEGADLAVSISRSATTGTYKGSSVDGQISETIALRRIGTTWKITHIHWSE